MIRPFPRRLAIKNWLRSEDENVTYIAALRSPEGIVMSADMLETYSYSEQVTYVEKIVVERSAPYQMAIAGAGVSTLIDAFIQLLNDTIKKDAPGNEDELRQVVESTLMTFYRNDVQLLRGKIRSVKFLIADTQGIGGSV